MKAFLILAILGTQVAVQKPMVMDCSKNPPCPEGKICSCLPGTYHQRSFTVDDRDHDYKFTIALDPGWVCEPDGSKIDSDSFTITCSKKKATKP